MANLTGKRLIAYYATVFVATMLLYPLLLYPFKDLTLFGHADFFRVGIGIPVAFTFLFGPAAALGAAFGNVIYDAATGGIQLISIFGFIGNLLLAYIPYKLWTVITAEKPDFRSLKKAAIFLGATFLGCSVCGFVIGWGLLWLYSTPYAMTSFTITLSDAVWAVVLGSAILAVSYGFVSRKKLLYKDTQAITYKPSWTKTRSLAILSFAVSGFLCMTISVFFTASVWVELPFIAVSLVAVSVACR